ncbi:MAG: DUF5362 family protein [bacterium]
MTEQLITADPASGDWNHPMGPGFGRTLGDMRFMGWVTMIYGILTCLTIVGMIVGIPVVVAANRFLAGVTRFEAYRASASIEELKAGFQDLGGSFRILKIITIVYLVLTALYLVFLFMMGGLSLLAGLADGY